MNARHGGQLLVRIDVFERNPHYRYGHDEGDEFAPSLQISTIICGAFGVVRFDVVSDNNSHGISRARCFLTRSFGRKNSVSCTIPYGVMQETLFLPYFDNELYNLHTTNPYRDTFHAIVDTVSCIMYYGFDILSDVFGHYNSIIGLKFQFFQNL